MLEPQKIDQAVERQEAAKAELYREDGARLYGDEEHAEREAAIDGEFFSTMDALEEDIDGQIVGGEEVLFAAANADPTDVLTTDELSSANSRRPFVSDEVFTLPLDKLTARCKAVLAQGDRPVMFLYSLYALQRVGETGADVAGNYLELKYGGGGEAVPYAEESGAGEVREIVGELKAKLDPTGVKKIASARKAIDEARQLKDYAYFRRRGATSAAELYLNNKYATTN